MVTGSPPLSYIECVVIFGHRDHQQAYERLLALINRMGDHRLELFLKDRAMRSPGMHGS
jgi:hypothetical protein